VSSCYFYCILSFFESVLYEEKKVIKISFFLFLFSANDWPTLNRLFAVIFDYFLWIVMIILPVENLSDEEIMSKKKDQKEKTKMRRTYYWRNCADWHIEMNMLLSFFLLTSLHTVDGQFSLSNAIRTHSYINLENCWCCFYICCC